MGSPFAQFVKLTAEVHKTWTLTPSLSLASRFFGGAVFTYGNSTAAPTRPCSTQAEPTPCAASLPAA